MYNSKSAAQGFCRESCIIPSSVTLSMPAPISAARTVLRHNAPYHHDLIPGWLSCVAIDPFDSSKAMFCTGFGIWGSNDIYAPAPTGFFRDKSIEETRVFQIVSVYDILGRDVVTATKKLLFYQH